MMDQRAFAADYILRWEDGCSRDPVKTHSLDPVDNGNWSSGQRGVGSVIGSNHGVTAAALAAYRGVPVAKITRDVMHKLNLNEAADIALSLYYAKPRLDLLPWNAVTASVMDMGWGTGPAQAIKLLQRMVGAVDDGRMGPATAAAYQRFISAFGVDAAAKKWAEVRNAFYDRIIASNPANAKYRNGWRNRTAYFTPGHKEGWWKRFHA